MAKILILQEEPGALQALRKSLQPHHDLLFAKNVGKATEILATQDIALIVSMVHLEETSMFDFLKSIKQDEKLCRIPFICFCGKRTPIAEELNAVLKKSAELLGADKYLNLEHFCSGEHCDYNKLRNEIESCLT